MTILMVNLSSDSTNWFCAITYFITAQLTTYHDNIYTYLGFMIIELTLDSKRVRPVALPIFKAISAVLFLTK